jgi:hypothetical protein
MKKIRLNPDALQVHSFDVTGTAQEGPGTVQGNSIGPYTRVMYDTCSLGCTQGGSCNGPCKPDSSLTECGGC